MEGALLGVFMMSACSFGIVLQHPSSPVSGVVRDELLRRAVMGIAMGGTAVALIYSRWGRRSGALMNPATTLCFLRLGRVGLREAAGYVAGQIAGAVGGVALMHVAWGTMLGHASVRHVVTVPGRYGAGAAWLGEFAITFVLMTVVLGVNRVPGLVRWTGVIAGVLVAVYITLEAPVSGTSMNPARTLGSAVWEGDWTALWVYFTAPLVGMLSAVEVQRLLARGRREVCGKWVHAPECAIRCNCLESRGIHRAAGVLTANQG